MNNGLVVHHSRTLYDNTSKRFLILKEVFDRMGFSVLPKTISLVGFTQSYLFEHSGYSRDRHVVYYIGTDGSYRLDDGSYRLEVWKDEPLMLKRWHQLRAS